MEEVTIDLSSPATSLAPEASRHLYPAVPALSTSSQPQQPPDVFSYSAVLPPAGAGAGGSFYPAALANGGGHQQQPQQQLHFGDVAAGHGGGLGGPEVTAVFGDGPPPPAATAAAASAAAPGRAGASSASWHPQHQQHQSALPAYPQVSPADTGVFGGAAAPSSVAVSSAGGSWGHEGGMGGGGGGAAVASMAVPTPQFMRGARSLVVAVEQGVRIAAGGPTLPGVDGSHVEYPITTRTTLPSWPASEVKVQRRFRDVVALAELLASTLPGRFLPQRPHRNAIQTRRATVRFLEQRRSALERYLNRLANHPAVLASAPFSVFLQAPGELRLSPAWAALQPPPPPGFVASTARLFKQMLGSASTAPSAREVTRSARSTGDMLRLVREQVASMQGAVQSASVTPLETELRDAGGRLDEFKKALSALSLAAVALVERGQGVARGYQGFGQALAQLAKYEEKYGYATGQCELRAAEGLARVSEVSMLCADHLAQQLLVVHEQLENLPVAQHALAVRERALLTSVTLENDLQRKQQALAAAQAQGPSGFGKAQALTSLCAELKASVGAAQDEYQRLCEHNSEELVAWRAGVQRELSAVVGDVGAVQAVQCQRLHQLWSETAVGLQQLRTSATYTAQS